jgi:predicted O-linked N-acetylglucosamine transferase (SPINDLY family)
MPDQTVEAAPLFETAARKARTGDLSVLDLIDAVETLRARHAGDAALTLYGVWTDHNAAHPLIHAVLFNYGVLLCEAGKLPEAQAAYERACALRPDFLAARINLGTVRERRGDVLAAIGDWYEAAQAPVPLSGETLAFKITAWKQAGRALESGRCEAQAEIALTRCLDLDPGQRDAAQHWIALRQSQCKWPPLEPFGRLALAGLKRAISPLSLNAYADDPIMQLANAHRYYAQDVAPPAPSVIGAWPKPDRAGKRPLRIGYLSSDLRDHAVGYLIAEVFGLHDRSQVEVHAYVSGPDTDDATRARIRATVDRWTDITPMPDKQAASRIVADDIDILVDLNGYTKDGRTRLIALRPAPIIVNWLGYPGTMGSPHHHYIIADPHIIPLGHERYYSEKVLRLPCYQPNDRRRVVDAHTPSRADCNLPDDAMVYCCFNGMNKITRPVFERWMRILAAVPGSVLWLLDSADATMERLRDHARACGIAPDRLVFAGRLPTPRHVARYAAADLFLDTSPYGAHTTASDALWAGLPILTYMGRSFAARVCGSLVHAAGLHELVCDSPESYERDAIRIGLDADLLHGYRQRLRMRRDRCTLFDTPRLVRALEDLYAQMFRDFASGALPVPDLTNLPVYTDIACDVDHESGDWRTPSDEAYRRQMEMRHAVSPLPPDRLLWPSPAPPLARAA